MRANGPKLRIGLVGAGGISGVHAAGWLACGADVVAWAPDGVERLVSHYGIDSAAGLDELLSQSDVIDVVTPTSTHLEVTLAALTAGLPTMCEKPLGATLQQALEIARAARTYDVPVFPAHVVRYFPEYEAIQRQVCAGRVGQPAVLRLSRAGEAPRHSPWFFDERASGGVISDQLVHDLDQARWIMGEVVAVYAAQNPPTTGTGEVPETVAAHILLTHASGALSHLHGFWGPPGLGFRTSVEVAGSAGVLSHDSHPDTRLSIDLPGSSGCGGGYLPPSTGTDPYEAQIRDFAESIRLGTEPRVSIEDGVIAVALAAAAAEAARTGRAVPFDTARVQAACKGSAR